MRRREFIAVVGNAAIGWPLAARAQQKKIDGVGVLLLDNADSALSALVCPQLVEADIQAFGRHSGFDIAATNPPIIRLTRRRE
jgi:hypothetical protein